MAIPHGLGLSELTHKQLEIYTYVLVTFVTDALVLNHQDIIVHIVNKYSLYGNSFRHE